MAARGQSLAERFARWQVLVNNLKDFEGFTHISEELGRLEQLLGEARTLENSRDEMRSQLRVMNARLRVISQEGDGLRARMGNNLQGKFGTTSESLIRFGFEPRRIPRRRSKRELELERAAEAVTESSETKAPAEAATPAGTEA